MEKEVKLIELNGKYYNDYVKGSILNEQIREALSSNQKVKIQVAGQCIFSVGFWDAAINGLYNNWPKEFVNENLEFVGLNEFDSNILEGVIKTSNRTSGKQL